MCPSCDGPSCSTKELGNGCFNAKLTWILDNDLSLIFALIMCLWVVLFVNFWKRTQIKIIRKWGLSNFKMDKQPIRPQYRAKANRIQKIRENPNNLEYESYVPLTKKIIPKICSFLIMFAGIVSLIIELALKNWLSQLTNYGVFNGIVYTILPTFYINPGITKSVIMNTAPVVVMLTLDSAYKRVAT